MNSLKVVGRCRKVVANGTAGNIGVRNSSGETVYGLGLGTSYATFTSGELARPGGGSWTPNDCQSGVTWLQARITAHGGSSSSFRVTTLYILLDYDPAGGAFLPLWSWLGPLLGSALTFEQFCWALDLVARVHPTIRSFSLRDARAYWRVFSAWRRPMMV